MKPSQYIRDFEERMGCAFSSKATINSYLSAVRSFFDFVIKRTETDPALLLRKYITIRLQGMEAKTINLHRAAVVKFFKLVKKIEINTVDVPRRKEPRKLPKNVAVESVQAAMEKTVNRKHRLIISIFYACGIRLCEIQRLRKKNIVPNKGIMRLEDTKGMRHRIVPIPESVRNNLYNYVAGMHEDELIFGNMCKRTFEKIVSDAFDRIGEKVSPHVLRHSFATDQISSGQDITKVQLWLGHSSIKTTQVYIHLSESLLSKSTDLLKVNYTN